MSFMDVDREINLLRFEAARLGDKRDDGTYVVKFGTLFDDDRCANLFEALVGTLKSAKKRGIVSFPGQILLKGPHDNVEIELLKPPAEGEKPPAEGEAPSVPSPAAAAPAEPKPEPAREPAPKAPAPKSFVPPASSAASAPAPAPARAPAHASGAAVDPDKSLASFEAKIFNPHKEFSDLTPKQISQLKKRFHEFDNDGSGDIDLMELKRMFEKLGDPQTHIALKTIMKEMDEDGSGAINFREFLLMYRKVREGHFSSITGLQELAKTVDVTKVGVKGAANFFQQQIERQKQQSDAESEIKAEQERKKQEREEAARRKAEFKQRMAQFQK